MKHHLFTHKHWGDCVIQYSDMYKDACDFYVIIVFLEHTYEPSRPCVVATWLPEMGGTWCSGAYDLTVEEAVAMRHKLSVGGDRIVCKDQLEIFLQMLVKNEDVDWSVEDPTWEFMQLSKILGRILEGGVA